MGDGTTAKIHEQRIEYRAGDATFVGYLAVPDTDGSQERPGILVFPEWWGLTEFPRQRAHELAGRGYVALAADMYGDGATTAGVEQAAEWSRDTRVGELSRERSRAALQVLTDHPLVDSARIASIGFCFGGDVALELARDGAELRGVAAFHAALVNAGPADPTRFHPKVLVLHGADDPLTPPDRVAAFQDEMRAARADWQFVSYGGAVHSFSNPTADDAGIGGVAYHEPTARRSWSHHLTFLEEVLA